MACGCIDNFCHKSLVGTADLQNPVSRKPHRHAVVVVVLWAIFTVHVINCSMYVRRLLCLLSLRFLNWCICSYTGMEQFWAPPLCFANPVDALLTFKIRSDGV